MKTGGGTPPTVTAGRSRTPRGAWIALILAPVVCGALALVVGRDAEGLTLAAPSALAFDLRWPRVVSALAAGAGMAAAGALLQRLLRNPLASPEIVGLSSGATLFLVTAVVMLRAPVHLAGAPAALIGAFAVLAVLIVLGRRQDAQPTAVVLVGVCLAALSDALLQFALAKGGEDAYMLVGWLAGSTFRTDPTQSLILTLGVALGLALALRFRRSLLVLTLEADIAAARGLEVGRARLGFLALAAALAGGVTAVVGPIAFLGLLAPHAARLLGAVRADRQLLAASLLGASLLTISDLAGRTALYPEQLPAGAGAAILGGIYFLALLGRRRL